MAHLESHGAEPQCTEMEQVEAKSEIRQLSEGPPERVASDVLNSLMEGCQVIGFDFQYLYVNDAVLAQAQVPRERLIGSTMAEHFPGIEQTPMFAVLSRCMRERMHQQLDNEFTFPDGRKGYFDLRFIPVPEGVCILSLDVTEKKRTTAALQRSEEQLRHAQKMQAIGRLAGSVAHDFNNILSVIAGYSQILLDDLASNDPMRDDLAEIQTAARRAEQLTRQLLTFSRQQVHELRVLDLNQSIRDMDNMIRRLVGEDIEVKTVAASKLGKVLGDPAHIEQVLMNLVVNARDAMPYGGRITIETQNVDLDASYTAQHLGTEPGPHVMLAVSDTGVGMDSETQQRIFEPFFTTKERGKGTGLGLSTVFGIVQQCKGSIWVYSELGKGTTFKIYLPRTRTEGVTFTVPPPVVSLRGSETVLLVEDDHQLRSVARTILSRNGYTVLEALTGGDAVQLCEQHPGQIDLLLTDVIMPRMSGREISNRVSELRPTTKVLFMSGYTEEAIVHHDILQPGVALLQKPITPDGLLRKIREVLDAPPMLEAIEA
ncbi:MAG TPA: ATP-binding protein [Polyangiaceae bacterium]|nr:ATP-binding protein [Polyangiaceae bacterium]